MKPKHLIIIWLVGMVFTTVWVLAAIWFVFRFIICD